MDSKKVMHLFLCQHCDSQDYQGGSCVLVYICPHCQGVAQIIRLSGDESRWRQGTGLHTGIDKWSDEDIERYLGLR